MPLTEIQDSKDLTAHFFWTMALTTTLGLSLTGELFSYAQGRVAFDTCLSAPNKCILLGGLSDGLLPVPYTTLLASKLPESWSLVQTVLSSSYTGFGHSSLDKDVAELDELVTFLKGKKCQKTAMVGHSTGTQGIVHYLRKYSLDAAALQAPVSDREGAEMFPEGDETFGELQDRLRQNVDDARALREEGKGDEMMPRSSFWAPITADRYLDLHEHGGRDDYFSSDFSDDELCQRLRHVGTSVENFILVACSGRDEYVPRDVDKEILMDRLCTAMNSETDGEAKAVPLFLPTGNHNLSSEGGADAQLFVESFVEMLGKVT